MSCKDKALFLDVSDSAHYGWEECEAQLAKAQDVAPLTGCRIPPENVTVRASETTEFVGSLIKSRS
jgi:hypothetical protein